MAPAQTSKVSNLADAMTADFAPPARTAKRVRAAVALAFDLDLAALVAGGAVGRRMPLV